MLTPTHRNVPGKVFTWLKKTFGEKKNITLFYDIQSLLSNECSFKSESEVQFCKAPSQVGPYILGFCEQINQNKTKHNCIIVK